MSWTITAGQPVPVDPNYSNVSLLLHGDGTNGSTTIRDNSSSPKTVTAVGDAKISTAQSKFGGSSIAFDRTADRLTASSLDFAFGTGDFTIEGWFYSLNVNSDRGFAQISSTSGGLSTSYLTGITISQGNDSTGQPSNGGICVAIDGANFMGSTANNSVLYANQWQHIAVTRSGTTCRVFVDGTQVGSRTSSANLTGSNLVVGGYYSVQYLIEGYIDDFRITKGVARYTSNFTPPTAPFPDA